MIKKRLNIVGIKSAFQN